MLRRAGAWPRDQVDRQIVADVTAGTGSIIDRPEAWPTLAEGTPYPDADGDGMDDGWEVARGLSAADAADRNADRDQDGYTELEEFLEALTEGRRPID